MGLDSAIELVDLSHAEELGTHAEGDQSAGVRERDQPTMASWSWGQGRGHGCDAERHGVSSKYQGAERALGHD